MERMLEGLIFISIIVLLIIGLEMLRSRHIQSEIKKMAAMQEQSQNFYQQLQQNSMDIQELSETLKEQREHMDCLLAKNRNADGEDIVPYTGNALLDVILFRKGKLAEEKNIRFEMEAEQVSGFPCEDYEIVSLFENVLDNAIEACDMVLQNREAVQKPFVSMQIKKLENEEFKYYIRIENSKNEECHPVEDHFATSKPDKVNHGNGVSIVQEIVEKYQGTIAFVDKGESFQVTIRI